MSLKEADLRAITFRQYAYKLKAFSSFVYGLIIAQIIALLSSFGGVGTMGGGSDSLNVLVKNYSSNLAIVFSIFWILVVSLMLTTKPYQAMDFTLVTNRLTGHLSNIGFMLTGCIFAGITSSLVGVLLRIVMYFTFDRSQILFEGFRLAYSDLLLSMLVGILYLILISSIGYFIGSVTQISVILPIMVAGAVIGLSRVYTKLIQTMVQFFASEDSLSVFFLKVIITSIVLYGLSILFTHRMEVGE